MATCKDVDTGSDQITQLCNFCDSNVSDGFCGDCEDHMCQSCFDIHTKAKACRHHVLLDSTCQKGDKNTYSESCKLHPSMIIKFYCVAHKIAGCVECIFPEHRNCNYQNIETAAKLFQDSGEDIRIKREIQRLENTHSEYTRQYKDDIETVAVINNTVVNDVKSFTDSVTSYVAQVEKHMLEQSESLHIENETRLKRRSNDLDSVGTKIEKCKMQLENEDRVDRLFISAIEIGPVLEQLRKNITSIGRQHVITKYDFQPNKLITEMTNGSGSFAEIRILSEQSFKNDLGKEDDQDTSTRDGENENYTAESTHSAPYGATLSTDTAPTGTMHSIVSTSAEATQSKFSTSTVTTQSTVSTYNGTTQSTVSTPTGKTQSAVSTPTGTTQSRISTPTGTTQSTVSTPTGTTQSTVSTYTGTTQSTVSTPTGTTLYTVSSPTGTTLSIVSTPTGTTQSTVSTPTGTTQSTVSTPTCSTQSTVSTPTWTTQSTVPTCTGSTLSTVSMPTGSTQSMVSTPTGTTQSTVSANPGSTQSMVSTPIGTTQSTVSTSIGTTMSTVSTPAGTTQSTVFTPNVTTQSIVSTPTGSTHSTASTSRWTTKSTVSTSTETTQSTVSTSTGTTHATVSTPVGTTHCTVSIPAEITQSNVSTPSWTTQSTVSTPTWTTMFTVSTPPATTHSTVSTPAGTTKSTVSTPSVTTHSTASTHAGTTQSTVSTSTFTTKSTVCTLPGTTQSTLSTPKGTTQSTVSTPAGTTQSTVSTSTGTTHATCSALNNTTQDTANSKTNISPISASNSSNLDVKPGNEPEHTEDNIFLITDAESYRNLTIHVRTSISKQSGKDTCYPFGCKTMDVYLRWKMAMRETSIFKQVVKKLPIAQKYRLDIARQNAALLIKASSGQTCTQKEALKVVSDVVDGIVKETKVYSCEGINLEGDNSEKVLKEIRQSRLSSGKQLVEAYDQNKDTLWVLFHPTVKYHVMGTVEKARKTSQTKTHQMSETLRFNYCLHQRLNDQLFKETFEQSCSSVEIKHEKMPEENEVIVTLRSETADTLQAAKIWIGKLEDNFSSLCSNYSDHGGHVSADLMTEFLNMSFEKEDIKHETNEKVHKVWIWSWSLEQTDLDKRTSKARNHIKRDNVFKSVTLPTANIDMINVIEKINKTFVQIVCKENEVVISGLCYLVDAILEELGIYTGSSKTGQYKPCAALETNFKGDKKVKSNVASPAVESQAQNIGNRGADDIDSNTGDAALLLTKYY